LNSEKINGGTICVIKTLESREEKKEHCRETFSIKGIIKMKKQPGKHFSLGCWGGRRIPIPLIIIYSSTGT